MTLAVIALFITLFVVQGWYRNRGGTFDALPDSLNTAEKWKGSDNDTWWARWTIRFTGWQAFGPLSKFSWARWSFPPKILFAVGGKGPWRYETFDGADGKHYEKVLSRCQYYKRWHFAVQRVGILPIITFHVYWRAKDVPLVEGGWVNNFSIKQLLFLYGPVHWDTTPVYWALSAYFGGQWK